MDSRIQVLLAAILLLLAGFIGGRLSYHSGSPSGSIGTTPATTFSHEATVITKTQLVYVEKAPGEKTDLDLKIGKPEIVIRINGKDAVFTQEVTEDYALQKYKIMMDQSSRVAVDIRVTPQDNTRHYGLGVGIGFNGIAGIGAFPVQGPFDGWVFADRAIGAAGIAIRF